MYNILFVRKYLRVWKLSNSLINHPNSKLHVFFFNTHRRHNSNNIQKQSTTSNNQLMPPSSGNQMHPSPLRSPLQQKQYQGSRIAVSRTSNHYYQKQKIKAVEITEAANTISSRATAAIIFPEISWEINLCTAKVAKSMRKNSECS